MFKLLGVLVAAYVLNAISKGKVYARSGITGRQIYRDESPTYFWTVIVVYSVLSIALMTVF